MDTLFFKMLASLFTQTVPGLIFLILFFLLLSIKYKQALYLSILTTVILLAFSSPSVKNHVVGRIERDSVQLIAPPSDITHIMVLSAGHKSSENTPAISQLNPSSLTRIVEGVRLWRQVPEAYFIVTGDSGLNEKDSTQALAARGAAIWLGVDEGKVITIETASNTIEEITEAAKVIGQGKLLLVSSAIHVPRAVYLAQAVGISVVGAPTHFMRGSQVPWWKFSASYLLHVDRALHEIVGKLWLRINKWLVIL